MLCSLFQYSDIRLVVLCLCYFVSQTDQTLPMRFVLLFVQDTWPFGHVFCCVWTALFYKRYFYSIHHFLISYQFIWDVYHINWLWDFFILFYLIKLTNHSFQSWIYQRGVISQSHLAKKKKVIVILLMVLGDILFFNITFTVQGSSI